jgi:hypothetical protein
MIAAFHGYLGETAISDNGVLQISRGVAFLLLAAYAMYALRSPPF